MHKGIVSCNWSDLLISSIKSIPFVVALGLKPKSCALYHIDLKTNA